MFRRLGCACFLAMLAAGPAWSSSVLIEGAAHPAADVVAMPAGSRELAIQNLPSIVRDVMRRSGVPGMAVAVVVGDKTVLAQGYGKRRIGEEADVDAQTVFQIASISKSISATVAAIAISDGTLSWNDPVRRYLPGFALSDAYVTQHATIGDFFAHRTGLPGAAGDDLEDLGFQREDILSRLGQLPLDSFRSSYHYANFSTTVGAQALAAAAGRPFETLAQERLFSPLGMASSSFRYDDFARRENRAALHAYKDGGFSPVGIRKADAQAAAGGVSSNVLDLARWMALLLSDGLYQGQRILELDALLPAVSPQSFSSRAGDMMSRSGFYGYGFNVNTELGGRVSLGHSGAFLLGAGTSFRIVPSAGVGIVVLSNGAPVGAAESVVATFVDIVLYGKPTRDWYAAYHSAMQGFFTPQADLSGKRKPAHPAHAKAFDRYIGQYDNPYFGPATIRPFNGGLVLELGPGRMRFPLRHWDGDTFAFEPAGEAGLVDSQASLTFGPQGADFTIPFYDADGQGRWQARRAP